MIESFSEYEGTYIVSRRKYLQSLIPEEVSLLEFNTPYGGRVTGTTPFEYLLSLMIALLV
jgi:hypothetical protein